MDWKAKGDAERSAFLGPGGPASLAGGGELGKLSEFGFDNFSGQSQRH